MELPLKSLSSLDNSHRKGEVGFTKYLVVGCGNFSVPKHLQIATEAYSFSALPAIPVRDE